MVEPVAKLLIGKGHPVRRVREVGLADASDAIVADYADANDLAEGRELTARERLAEHYRTVVTLFYDGKREVVLPADGQARDRARRSS